ncbi:MAG: HesA/MoeB/ThiF family protein [bacterium]|nr:HesA/MoeB/ThiF family protein [bacterium]
MPHPDTFSLDHGRALVIGVGGLGSPAAMALAAAGVGTLGLMDPDVVEISNLHRQPLYDEADVGRPKVLAAAARLHDRHPALAIETEVRRFGADDEALLAGWDVVLDGTDTIAAKFTVNDAAVAAEVPLIHAGALGWRTQLLTVLPHGSACYRCLFEEAPPADEVPSCQEAGVLGPAVVLAGTLQAGEAVRILAHLEPAFRDRLLTIDTRTGTWRSVPLSRDPNCAACGDRHEVRAAQRSNHP